MEFISVNQVSEISVIYKPAIGEKPLVKSCLDAYSVIRGFFSEDTISVQEHFVVLYLNQAQRVIAGYKVSTGGITSTVGDLRLIFSVALKSLATGFIVGHNHPSGNMQPSSQDMLLTQKLKDAGLIMDIKLIDHIILGPEKGNYYSFADNGLI